MINYTEENRRAIIVSCLASLLHAENESGETSIQFWFRAPKSWRGQSDYRTVHCLRHGRYLKKIAMLI